MQRSQPVPDLPDADRAAIAQQNPGESDDLWKTLRSTRACLLTSRSYGPL